MSRPSKSFIVCKSIAKHRPLFVFTYRKQVMSTAAEAERDGVKVPTTLAEYCVQTRVPSQDSSSDLLYDDLYDDDMEEEDEEEDESEMESVGEAGGISAVEDGGTSTRRYDNQDDSGNEDS